MRISQSDYQLIPLYEYGLLINFNIKLSDPAYILQVRNEIEKRFKSNIVDFVPAYHSITIHLSPPHLVTTILSNIDGLLTNFEFGDVKYEKIQLTIPVCFSDAFASDKKRICDLLHNDWTTITKELTQQTFTVYMLGFLPGFAYMGMLPENLKLPRLESPRKKVNAGSVAIADLQTGIYPTDSPGGWNIIGRTPIAMFDLKNEQPTLLQVGNIVRYVEITEDEFYVIQNNPTQWKMQVV